MPRREALVASSRAPLKVRGGGAPRAARLHLALAGGLADDRAAPRAEKVEVAVLVPAVHLLALGVGKLAPHVHDAEERPYRLAVVTVCPLGDRSDMPEDLRRHADAVGGVGGQLASSSALRQGTAYRPLLAVLERDAHALLVEGQRADVVLGHSVPTLLHQVHQIDLSELGRSGRRVRAHDRPPCGISANLDVDLVAAKELVGDAPPLAGEEWRLELVPVLVRRRVLRPAQSPPLVRALRCSRPTDACVVPAVRLTVGAAHGHRPSVR